MAHPTRPSCFFALPSAFLPYLPCPSCPARPQKSNCAPILKKRDCSTLVGRSQVAVLAVEKVDVSVYGQLLFNTLYRSKSTRRRARSNLECFASVRSSWWRFSRAVVEPFPHQLNGLRGGAGPARGR